MAKIKDLTGQRFGLLVVLGIGEQVGNHAYKWFCRCDCGIVKQIKGGNLKSGHTISCGCYKKEHPYKTHPSYDPC